MAESILRLRVDNQEYDAKLKSASEGLQRLAKSAHDCGGSITNLEKNEVAFIRELGIPTTLREVGTTEEMLPLIADSTILGGGYKQLTAEDVLCILKACY